MDPFVQPQTSLHLTDCPPAGIHGTLDPHSGNSHFHISGEMMMDASDFSHYWAGQLQPRAPAHVMAPICQTSSAPISTSQPQQFVSGSNRKRPWPRSEYQPVHHHHHLPDSVQLSKRLCDEKEKGNGAPCVVGKAGMPKPAPKPRKRKLNLTTEDDQLLIELKESKNLTWSQIADFVPGRSAGTLQVRYCSKLKTKTISWTSEKVSRAPV